jgi:hypothetical protein
MPSQDHISSTGQNNQLYRSATSAPSATQARAGATHAPENLIVAITSPCHPRPPADATVEPRTLLAANKTDIANARDQKGSSLTAPRPSPSCPGRAMISPPHNTVATNATATAEMTGLVRPWEEGAARSAHARRTHVTSGGAARTGPRTSTGGGAGGGGTTRSWTLRGSGGAIIRPPSSAQARDKRGRSKDGTADVDRRRRWRRRDDPIVDVAGERQCDNSTIDVAQERRRDNSTAVIGPLLVAGRTALPSPPTGSGGAFFAVPPAVTVPQTPQRTIRTTAHAWRTHAMSGGTGRTHTGTVDVDRRRRRRRRDNPIADIAGERRRNNSTAAVGSLSGAGKTASTLPPAGVGGAFFTVPPAVTVPRADAAEDNDDNGGEGGPAAASGEEGQMRRAVGEVGGRG